MAGEIKIHPTIQKLEEIAIQQENRGSATAPQMIRGFLSQLWNKNGSYEALDHRDLLTLIEDLAATEEIDREIQVAVARAPEFPQTETDPDACSFTETSQTDT